MENSLVDPPDCRISQDTSMVSPALLSASARPHVSLPSARLRNSFRWSMQRNFEQCSPSAWPTTPGRQVRSPRLRTVRDAELTIVASYCMRYSLGKGALGAHGLSENDARTRGLPTLSFTSEGEKGSNKSGEALTGVA